MFGWYSKEAAKRYTAFIYTSPKGEEIRVTSISESETTPPSCFGDEVCVGPVVEFLRSETPQEKLPFIYNTEQGFGPMRGRRGGMDFD